MDRLAYLQNLYAAWRADQATLDVVAGISPHVDPEQLLAELNDGAIVAVPPVYVAGAYHTVQKVDGGGLLFRAVRPTASFRHPESRRTNHASELRPAPHADAAKAYAGEHWSGDLFEDVGRTSLAYALRDRTELTELHDDAKFVAQLCAIVGADLLSDDAPSPTELASSVLYISHVPLSQFEIGELAVQGSARYCSLCGHWLDVKKCPGCNRGFPVGQRLEFADFGITRLPMPQQVIDAFRERGHLQGVDAEQWLRPATS